MEIPVFVFSFDPELDYPSGEMNGFPESKVFVLLVQLFCVKDEGYSILRAWSSHTSASPVASTAQIELSANELANSLVKLWQLYGPRIRRKWEGIGMHCLPLSPL
jgi:hypothetical protein